MTNGKGLQFAERHAREAAEMKPILQLKYGEKSRKKPEQATKLSITPAVEAFWRSEIHTLHDHWTKCVNVGGDYVEKYLLDITFLVILLIPNIALSCKNRNLNMTEVMNDFQYIISQDFEDLKALLDSKLYSSFDSEPQKSKRSLCSDGREIKSIHRMTCSIVHITNTINFDFTLEIMALSRKTERVLKCHCKRQKHQKTKIRKPKTPTKVRPQRRTKSSQKKLLRIKNKIADLYLCWKKMYKFTK